MSLKGLFYIPNGINRLVTSSSLSVCDLRCALVNFIHNRSLHLSRSLGNSLKTCDGLCLKTNKHESICSCSACQVNVRTGTGKYVNRALLCSQISPCAQLTSRFSTCTSAFQKVPGSGWRDEKVKEKSENVFTVPNLLTGLRMVATPVLGYMVLHDQFTLALGLFVAAGLTDMLDGYIARNFKNQKTVFGSYFDPLADKFLVGVLTVSLTFAGLIPGSLTLLIVSRDVFLVASAFYVRYVSLPPPKTLARYFDVTHPTAKLHPSTISKVNTLLQISLVAGSLAAPVFGFVDHLLLQYLGLATGITTVLSWAKYIAQRNSHVTFIQPKMRKRL